MSGVSFPPVVSFPVVRGADKSTGRSKPIEHWFRDVPSRTGNQAGVIGFMRSLQSLAREKGVDIIPEAMPNGKCLLRAGNALYVIDPEFIAPGEESSIIKGADSAAFHKQFGYIQKMELKKQNIEKQLAKLKRLLPDVHSVDLLTLPRYVAGLQEKRAEIKNLEQNIRILDGAIDRVRSFDVKIFANVEDALDQLWQDAKLSELRKPPITPESFGEIPPPPPVEPVVDEHFEPAMAEVSERHKSRSTRPRSASSASSVSSDGESEHEEIDRMEDVISQLEKTDEQPVFTDESFKEFQAHLLEVLEYSDLGEITSKSQEFLAAIEDSERLTVAQRVTLKAAVIEGLKAKIDKSTLNMQHEWRSALIKFGTLKTTEEQKLWQLMMETKKKEQEESLSRAFSASVASPVGTVVLASSVSPSLAGSTVPSPELPLRERASTINRRSFSWNKLSSALKDLTNTNTNDGDLHAPEGTPLPEPMSPPQSPTPSGSPRPGKRA